MDTVGDVVYLQDAVRAAVSRALPVTRRSLPLSQAQALDNVVYLLNEVSSCRLSWQQNV